MLGGSVSFKILTHVRLYSYMVYAVFWGHPKVGLCVDSSPKRRCTLARPLSVVLTAQVWLPVSQNTSGACTVLVSRMQINPGIDISGANCGESDSFHFCSFPRSLKLWQRRRWQYRWRLQWEIPGMLPKSGACGAKENVPKFGLLGEGCQVGGADGSSHGRVSGVVPLDKKLFRAGAGSNLFNFQERWGWTFLFLLLHCSDPRSVLWATGSYLSV